MTTSAKIIKDSVNRQGNRLTTLQLCYWRAIHAEAKTHRVISSNGEEYEQIIFTQDDSFMSEREFSRNASSSRAIPVAKMIEQVRTNPAGPVHWGANRPGMQAHEELTGEDLEFCKAEWLIAANAAADSAERMQARGLHKQVANRVLEPYQWIHVVVSFTESDNFFQLRDHKDADPNIQQLARAMRKVMGESKPTLLLPGEWHLPYITTQDCEDNLRSGGKIDLRKVSAARCARVSYLTHDGARPCAEKDMKLFTQLAGGDPLHASPLEHQGTPGSQDTGNFRGWTQFRKLWERQVQEW